MTDTDSIRILEYDDRFAADFGRINRAWLEDYGLLEDADVRVLEDPRGTILDAGGAILVAVEAGRVLGTCAVIPSGAGAVELAKLAVVPDARGRGLGRRLTLAALARARAMGATRVELVSNHRLADAIRLYESLGFRHAPMPDVPGYATADVCMELALDSDPAPGSA